jgi:hypothetical protein
MFVQDGFFNTFPFKDNLLRNIYTSYVIPFGPQACHLL